MKDQIVIGKNIIETLTMGMYDDPRFVFREYVQNGADSIDSAIESGVLAGIMDGRIDITIDPVNRFISIADNAMGVMSSKVRSLLGNIAQSTKNKETSKGFRGIGRLGGLAYCDTLIFETSYAGERSKSIMTWNARKLKQIINNNKDVAAAELISVITSYQNEREEPGNHYFKVMLMNVDNDSLLDLDSVNEYLSMVAPVPYSNDFSFKDDIEKRALKRQVKLDAYVVNVNNKQLFKGYKDDFYENGKVVDSIFSLRFFNERIEKDLLYWGWYGITHNQNQIPAENKEKSIRLRKHNIQIGLEGESDKYHKKDSVGNRYFIGEIHAVHKDLKPNARRDSFEENPIQRVFASRLKEFFADELYSLYYDFSKKNAAIKLLEWRNSIQKKIEDNEAEDNHVANIDLRAKLNDKQKVIEKSVNQLLDLHKKYEGEALSSIIEQNASTRTLRAVRNEIRQAAENDDFLDSLEDLKEFEKKLVSRILKAIRAGMPKAQADKAIQVIKKELSNS